MPTTYAIPNGRTVMDATTYTGTGATQTISNADLGSAGFQPDMIWFKSRATTYAHALFDSVRGATQGLSSNSTATEYTSTAGNDLSAFTSTGFTVGAPQNWNSPNNSGSNPVAWQWKAGGTAVSNTSGSITSSVSANTTAGFSIVTYTGNNTNGASIGHGLGVTPEFFIIKSRSSAQSWGVYHKSLSSPNNSYLLLESTAAQATFSGIWTPSSSTITFPTATTTTNGNTFTYVAYCWTPIAGFSQFGSYNGNSSSDGPFIYTGFRPKFFLIKKYTNNDSIVAHWQMFDSSRNTYNITNFDLSPDTVDAEITVGGQWDFLSNGIKVRSSDTYTNKTGESYLYAAFAENPFKYANAR